MSRDIDASVVTASEGDVIRPILMFDGDFQSGHLRLHSGVGTITYDGNTYAGSGMLGRVSPIDEDVELSASGVRVSLSGIDGSNISVALGEHYQGRMATLYIALLDSAHQIIGEPVILFQGRMDNMNLTLGNQNEVSLTIENPLRDWDRPRERRYNNTDQNANYPADKGLEFVEQSVQKPIYWGGETPR